MSTQSPFTHVMRDSLLAWFSNQCNNKEVRLGGTDLLTRVRSRSGDDGTAAVASCEGRIGICLGVWS